MNAVLCFSIFAFFPFLCAFVILGWIGIEGGEGEVRVGHSELSSPTSCERILVSISSVGDSKDYLLIILQFSFLETKRSVDDSKSCLLFVIIVSILGVMQSVDNSKYCLLIEITASILGVGQSVGDSKTCLLITLGTLLLLLYSLVTVGNSLSYLQIAVF